MLTDRAVKVYAAEGFGFDPNSAKNVSLHINWDAGS